MTRKNKLRIDGIPENAGENHEQIQKKVEAIIEEKMTIKMKLNCAIRIGKNDTTRKPRTIITKFDKYIDRQQCLRSAPKLKRSDVFLNEDVSKMTLQKRMSLMNELKEKR